MALRAVYSPTPTKTYTQDPRERAMSVVEQSRANNDARARAAQLALQYGAGPSGSGGGGGGGVRYGGGGGGYGGFDIGAAIAAARASAAAQESDFRQRGRNAEAATGKLFQGLMTTATGLNAGINKMYTDAAAETEKRGQGLIDGILKSNEAAIMGTKDLLSEAGIKGVGQEGMTQNLSVEPNIAKEAVATQNTNMDMTGAAQTLLGGNFLSGVAYDRDEKKKEIQDQINRMVSDIRSNLASYVSSLRSRGSYGGGSRGYSGGSSGGSRGVGLPGDAYPIPENMIGSVASGKLSLQNVANYLSNLEGRTGINLPGVSGSKAAPSKRPTYSVSSSGRRGGSGTF